MVHIMRSYNSDGSALRTFCGHHELCANGTPMKSLIVMKVCVCVCLWLGDPKWTVVLFQSTKTRVPTPKNEALFVKECFLSIMRRRRIIVDRTDT